MTKRQLLDGANRALPWLSLGVVILVLVAVIVAISVGARGTAVNAVNRGQELLSCRALASSDLTQAQAQLAEDTGDLASFGTAATEAYLTGQPVSIGGNAYTAHELVRMLDDARTAEHTQRGDVDRLSKAYHAAVVLSKDDPSAFLSQCHG